MPEHSAPAPYFGPRRKTANTYKLELILAAMLDKNTIFDVRSDDFNNCLVKFNDKEYNLTEIIDSRPDFEQLSFTQQQLDAYLDLVKDQQPISLPKEPAYLHPAERLAIYFWTKKEHDLSHESTQNLLRGNTASIYSPKELKCLLTTICIAARSLSKPNPLAIQDPTKTSITSFRGENPGKYLADRISTSKQQKSVITPGFTASSMRYIPNFGSIKTEICQPASLNPMGKDIAKLSAYSREQEVLFPPNTEFFYTATSSDNLNWQARPVRTINQEREIHAKIRKDGQEIQRDLNLPQVFQDNVKFKLKALHNFLQIQQVKNTHSGLRRFFWDTVNNADKLSCLTPIVSLLDTYQNSKEVTNKNIEELFNLIETSITKNQSLCNSAKLRASLGNTGKALASALETVEGLKNIFPEFPSDIPKVLKTM